jgi:hypothetical protein
MLLAACDNVGAAEAMPYSQARANVIRLAGSGSAQAFCSEEGRLEFRRAVRSLSAAAERENVEMQPMQMQEGDEAVGLIMVGLLARIVKPSDLRGDYRAIATIMNMPGAMNGMGDTRDAMAKACPELVTVYREMAGMMRLMSRMEDTEDMSPRARERLGERVQSQQRRVQLSLERLEAKMRAEGWTGPENGGPMMIGY